MNYTRTSPIGIDYPIQKLQSDMYNYLCGLWGVTDATYDCYGRCYRLDDGQGNYTPAAYANGKEYAPLVMNDKVIVQSYFDVAETIKVDAHMRNNATVYLIFDISDITKIYPENTDRCDEQIRNDVANYCNTLYGFQLTAIQIGSKKALSEFTGNIIKQQKPLDMQPRHIFRLDFTLNQYSTNFSNC